MSDLRCEDLRCQVLDVRSQMSGLRCEVLDENTFMSGL